MTDAILYGLKNCDSCRKAQKDLENAGKSVTFVDIRAEADLQQKVPAWMARMNAGDLVNKRSPTWRGLTNAEQDSADEPGDLEQLLIAHPTLIKRPVIEMGRKTFVGWTPKVKQGLGL